MTKCAKLVILVSKLYNTLFEFYVFFVYSLNGHFETLPSFP